MRSTLTRRATRAGIVVAALGSLSLVPAVESMAAPAPSSASSTVSQKAPSADAAQSATGVGKKKGQGKKKPRPVRVVKEYTEFDGKFMVHTKVYSNGKVVKWRTKAHIIDNPTPTPSPTPEDDPTPAPASGEAG
ncbi:hypothetical protein [Streptomyces sp. NPDC051218]|uniref:hypothetical protein n=1 Tax=Streptomyces sp. NPDC051218 TaxID=3365645 RepID=UPI0037B1B130